MPTEPLSPICTLLVTTCVARLSTPLPLSTRSSNGCFGSLDLSFQAKTSEARRTSGAVSAAAAAAAAAVKCYNRTENEVRTPHREDNDVDGRRRCHAGYFFSCCERRRGRQAARAPAAAASSAGLPVASQAQVGATATTNSTPPRDYSAIYFIRSSVCAHFICACVHYYVLHRDACMCSVYMYECVRGERMKSERAMLVRFACRRLLASLSGCELLILAAAVAVVCVRRTRYSVRRGVFCFFFSHPIYYLRTSSLSPSNS